MGDVQTAPAPVKDVSDRSASSHQGEQSWNGGAARDIWGKPPVPGQKMDASPAAQQAEAGGKDNPPSAFNPGDATTTSKHPDVSDQSVKSTGPKEATTNANDQSRNNNAKDQSQPTLQPQDAPQLTAETPQEAPTPSNQKQHSLPDGSLGTDERTNGHDNLKLGVADNQFRLTPELAQKVEDNAKTTFDAEIDRQIAALPGAALEGIGNGLDSLAQMGLFVGGTVLNELKIVGDVGVLAVDAAVVPSFAAGDLKVLGDDSNSLADKGIAVMDGVGKVWAPIDQDCQNIGGSGEYPRLLTDPVKAAINAYDNFSSQSAPDQVNQIADATTQVVVPVAGESMIGAAAATVRKEALGATAAAADGTVVGTIKAKMSELMERMKETISKYDGTDAARADAPRAIEPGIDGPKEPANIQRTRDHLNGSETLKPVADQIKIEVSSEVTVIRDGKPVTLTANPKFTEQVQDLVDNLDPHEKMFLDAQGTKVVAVADIKSVFPDQSIKAAGLYDPKTNTIYIPEKIGEKVTSTTATVDNPATAFHVRHELGHNFCARSPLGHMREISETPAFVERYEAACDGISQHERQSLGITKDWNEYNQELAQWKKNGGTEKNFPMKDPVMSKDEIFADLYGHATGMEPKTGYSQRIEAAFSAQCEGYIRQKVAQYIAKLIGGLPQ